MMNAVARIQRRTLPEHGPWEPGTPALLQRLYAARGVRSSAEAELKLAKLLSPAQLGGMQAAVDLLMQAIQTQRHIVVVGDFDCDGATGTAVAVRGLRMLGARNISYRVPHRILHGYGLSPGLVDDLVGMQPDLLITVDSGIACHAGVAAAKARGWQVLITDHHLPGEHLPDADVIVDPNLQGDAFPSKSLAGVGVMFYVLLALRQRLRAEGSPQGEADLQSLLDLVAVGTVADLVPLDYNNRLLVSAGLKRLRQGFGHAGLRALAAVSGRDISQLSANDIGFYLGPRLNAAGRLEDMALGIECLLTDDACRAQELAELLHAINAERRGVQDQMQDEAEAALALLQSQEVTADGRASVCLFDEGWHPGVVGLLASRIKDRVHLPAVAFAPAEEGSDRLRGSARSIPGLHVRDALADVDARHPGLIERFGGHAMAAGLSLAREHFPRFAQAFDAAVAARLDADLREAVHWSDGPLSAEEMQRATVHQLRAAGPWGQGFPEPQFDEVFACESWKVVGGKHLKLSLRHPSGRALNAIHFSGWQGQPPPERLHAVFQLDLDDFMGRNDIQLLIRHWQPA